MKSIFVSALLGCVVAACGNPTIDVIDGTYEAYFVDGDLDDRISDIDDSDRVIITFYGVDTCEGEVACTELWADVEFRGLITFTAMEVIDVILAGPEEDVVRGITVDDVALRCKHCKFFKRRRTIRGTFSHDHHFLELWSDGIGTLPFERVD